MTVNEGNKLIFLFMGAAEMSSHTDSNGIKTIKSAQLGDIYARYFDTDLKYHSSWDWLIPVVEKIHGLDLTNLAPEHEYPINKVRVEINYPYCYISAGGWWDHEGGYEDQLVNISSYNNRIEEKDQLKGVDAVWHSVTQFIQWYNKERK